MRNRTSPFEDPQYAEWINMLKDIPMEEVADMYDIERHRTSILCPEHADKNVGNCKIFHNKYHCFACDAKGDNIRLVQKHLNIGYMAAARDLAKMFGYEVYEPNTKQYKDPVQFDYMPVTKKQLVALGLLPNKTPVFVVEKYQEWKDADMISKPDLGGNNTGYMIGGNMLMSMERLYKEDKESFYAVIAGKFKEATTMYLQLYKAKAWELSIFSADIKLDFQTHIEDTLKTLDEFAHTMVEQRIMDLSYFKIPEFKQKKTRYQLTL